MMHTTLLGLLLPLLATTFDMPQAGLACPALPSDPADDDHNVSDPTGVLMGIRKDGEMTDWTIVFDDGGFWSLVDGSGKEIGWGLWEYDAAAQQIHYVNLSNDGGGGQTGTYTWNSSTAEWDRTYCSSPGAPQISAVPPL